MDQQPKDPSSVPEETTGVPKELASEVREEEEGVLKEATGDVVAPPTARRMGTPRRKRAWDYWSS